MTTPVTALTPAEIDSVVAATADAAAAHFLRADRGRALADRLRRGIADGEYAAAVDSETLARRITADLQAVQNDLHLRLQFRPEGVPDDTDPAADEEAWREQARRTAGGVRAVRRRGDGIAVLELAPVLCHPAHAGEVVAAAMTLVADAAALVLDVRDCVGGAPATVALICSYLLGPEPVHLIDIESSTGREQSWSHAWVPGRRFGPDRPVAVLTSARTFSGGEELAFDLQELGRAELVGERTRGGAHPRVGVRVHSHLEVTVPCARAVSPRTDTNWEGVGVTPDLEVPEGQALDAALRRLSERLC